MIERDPKCLCDWCKFGEVSSRRQPCNDCSIASVLSYVVRFEIDEGVARAVEKGDSE